MVVLEEMDFSSDAESEDEEAAGPTERGDQSRTSEFDYKWGGWEGLGGLGSPEHVTVLIWKDFDIAQCHFQFLIVKVLTGFQE